MLYFRAFCIVLFLLSFALNARAIPHDEVIKICKNICLKKEQGKCTLRGYRDCDLISAIIKRESSYSSEAFNPEVTGSYGLMQIQCSTAKSVGLKYSCKQLFNPTINIRFGILYIRSIEEKLKGYSVDDILSAYNAGLTYNNGKYISRRCRRFRKFNWHGMPTVICYKGEYINQEYVWYTRRYYDHLKREKDES